MFSYIVSIQFIAIFQQVKCKVSQNFKLTLYMNMTLTFRFHVTTCSRRRGLHNFGNNTENSWKGSI